MNDAYRGQGADAETLWPSRATVLVVAILLLSAFLVRARMINEPGVAPEREFRSALLSRAFSLAAEADAPAWRKHVSHTVVERERFFEPPGAELVASLVHRFTGMETVRAGRLLSSLYWVAGGAFLFLILLRFCSPGAAILPLVYYLFAPHAIAVGRSFQPDSLMILLFLVAILALIRNEERSSRLAFAAAALSVAVAILMRPLVLFPLVGAVVALRIRKNGPRGLVRDAKFWTLLALGLTPFVLYYVVGGLMGDAFLPEHIETKFRPHLLAQKLFWRGWLTTASNAAGFWPILLGLAGVPLVRRGIPLAIVLGTGLGYVAFCLAFNYHIHQIGYYHAQLIVIVGLSVGPLAETIGDAIRVATGPKFARAVAALVVILFVILSAVEARDLLSRVRRENPVPAREIGELINHNVNVVYVGIGYGVPLMYYSETAGMYWPRTSRSAVYQLPGEAGRSVEQRMSALGFEPEYLVVTDFDSYEMYHGDLHAYLSERGEVVAGGEEYAIYRLPTDGEAEGDAR